MKSLDCQFLTVLIALSWVSGEVHADLPFIPEDPREAYEFVIFSKDMSAVQKMGFYFYASKAWTDVNYTELRQKACRKPVGALYDGGIGW